MRIFCPAIACLRSCRSVVKVQVGLLTRGSGLPTRLTDGGRFRPPSVRVSLDDLGDPAGADGTATLTDGEPQALLHGEGLAELPRHLGDVPGHDQLGARGQRDDAGDVRGPEVELRTVVVEERRV